MLEGLSLEGRSLRELEGVDRLAPRSGLTTVVIMRGATEYHSVQPLTEWSGDVASLITEMKRRSGVRTDQELARFIGSAQSTVSNWRKRGGVPEAALLQFERAVEEIKDIEFARSLAARTLALRIPELWYERIGSTVISRAAPYGVVSHGFNGIVAEIARQMERLEADAGLSTAEITPRLLEDTGFLNGVIDWIASASAGDLLHREIEAARRAAAP